MCARALQTPLQQALYTELVSTGRKQDALAVLTLLEQACSHPNLLYFAEKAATPLKLSAAVSADNGHRRTGVHLPQRHQAGWLEYLCTEAV